MKKNSQRTKSETWGTFDPQDQPLERRKLGVSDLYVERNPNLTNFPTSWRIEKYTGLLNDLPYLSRTIRDVSAVAWPLLFLYVAITLVKSLSPALNLWFSGQFLNIVTRPGRRLQARRGHAPSHPHSRWTRSLYRSGAYSRRRLVEGFRRPSMVVSGGSTRRTSFAP